MQEPANVARSMTAPSQASDRCAAARLSDDETIRPADRSPHGIKALAAAVLVRAMREAQEDAHVAAWLHGDDALFWVQAIGVERERWRALLAGRTPGELLLPTALQLLVVLPAPA